MFFTVKNISAQKTAQEQMRQSFVESRKIRKSRSAPVSERPIINERRSRSPDIKTKPDLSAYIKDKASAPIVIRESKISPNVRMSSGPSPSPAAPAKEKQVQLAKKKLATAKGRKAAAKRQLLGRLKEALDRAVKRAADKLLLACGAALVLLIPVVLVFGIAGMMFGSGEQNRGSEALSEEVMELSPYIFAYACEHELEEYTGLIKALMMQESGGRGTDPMQASECMYNTRYPQSPGGITDPEYSINVGIQYFKDCLELAGAKGPEDMEGIALALQGYNFGSGYISWARANYGGHSELSALEFSQMMAAQNGWPSYGDIYYVNHVLRYYGTSDN